MAHELISMGGEQHSNRLLLQVPRSVADHLDGLMEVNTAIWPQVEGAEGSRALYRCRQDGRDGSMYVHGLAFSAGNDKAVHEWLVTNGAAQNGDLAERSRLQRGCARYLLGYAGGAARGWYLLDPPDRPNLTYYQLASLFYGIDAPEYTPYLFSNGRPSPAMRCLKTAMDVTGNRGLFRNAVLAAGATALVGVLDERQAAQHV